jgi:hypothetical protein
METIPVLSVLEQFADAIDEHGIAAVPADLLRTIVDAGRRYEVSPIALAVLVDPTEPEVVRERAFSRVAIQLIGRAVGDAGARELVPA